MNATFSKIAPPAHREILTSLCERLHQRDFHGAEMIVMDLLNETLIREYNTTDDVEQALSDIRTVYLRFNQYYLRWAEEKGLDLTQEKKKLAAAIHQNYLFAHCSDPESMDDLVYAVADSLMNIEDETQMDEAVYQLSCYTRSIAQQ